MFPRLLLYKSFSVSYLSPAHSLPLPLSLTPSFHHLSPQSGQIWQQLLYLITKDEHWSLWRTDGLQRPDLPFHLIARVTGVQTATYGGGSINSPGPSLSLCWHHFSSPWLPYWLADYPSGNVWGDCKQLESLHNYSLPAAVPRYYQWWTQWAAQHRWVLKSTTACVACGKVKWQIYLNYILSHVFIQAFFCK